MAKQLLNRLKGHWALVTGASAGIGREFCRQLAEAGLNLVMVARSGDALEALGKELEAAAGVQCLALPVDLQHPESAARLLAELESRQIAITMLVNNAGVGRWGHFAAADVECLRNIITVNALAAISLCRTFHDQLKRQAPDAVVINVSSQAALQPVPFMAVYAASKALLHNFSLALYEEWREQGIHVQTLIPGPTQTGFDQKAGAYGSKIVQRDSPEKVVRASLQGLSRRKPVVASVRGVYTQRLFNGLFPPRMVTREVAKMFRPPAKD